MHSPHATARRLAALADQLVQAEAIPAAAIDARVEFVASAALGYALGRLDRLGRLISRVDLGEPMLFRALDDYRFRDGVRARLLDRAKTDEALRDALAAQLGAATLASWEKHLSGGRRSTVH